MSRRHSILGWNQLCRMMIMLMVRKKKTMIWWLRNGKLMSIILITINTLTNPRKGGLRKMPAKVILARRMTTTKRNTTMKMMTKTQTAQMKMRKFKLSNQKIKRFRVLHLKTLKTGRTFWVSSRIHILLKLAANCSVRIKPLLFKMVPFIIKTGSLYLVVQ